jgi:hypothetical protein
METLDTSCTQYSLRDDENETWKLDGSHAIKKSFKHYAKNHKDESASCFSNLDMVLNLLNTGCNLSQLGQMLSFFRHEKQAVYRIGQTGVKYAKETRLYIVIIESNKTIYPISMGSKDTQQDDINTAVKHSNTLRKSEEK